MSVVTITISEIVDVNPRIPTTLAIDLNREVDFVPMAQLSEQGFVTPNGSRQLRDVLKGYTYFENGDVIIAKITPCMENGKAAFVDKLPHKVGFGSTEFHVLRPGASVDGRYLFYMVWNSEFRNEAEGNMTGSAGQKRVPKAFFDRFQIPLPSLSAQKRIADILDKADDIRRNRRQAKDLASTFQKSLCCEMFGDPITNEMNWPVKSFGELAVNQDGRRKPVKASDRLVLQGEYPYYGASGIIDYVDSFLFDETALLIGEDGANLLARSTPIAFLATGKYWVNNHAHIVTPNGKATLKYLSTHLNMRNIRDFVTGSAQPKLNQANLNKIPIPCPPLALQEEFDRRVNSFNVIREKQNIADNEVASTFNSLVQRAFKGEL